MLALDVWCSVEFSQPITSVPRTMPELTFISSSQRRRQKKEILLFYTQRLFCLLSGWKRVSLTRWNWDTWNPWLSQCSARAQLPAKTCFWRLTSFMLTTQSMQKPLWDWTGPQWRRTHWKSRQLLSSAHLSSFRAHLTNCQRNAGWLSSSR